MWLYSLMASLEMLTLNSDPLSAFYPQEYFEREAYAVFVFCVAIFSQTIVETSLNVNLLYLF